jgi:hypothetical protein
LLCLLFAGSVSAQSVTLQCGQFRFEMIENSMSKINGEFVTSQKITELGKTGGQLK